jgi:hypothetical protein
MFKAEHALKHAEPGAKSKAQLITNPVVDDPQPLAPAPTPAQPAPMMPALPMMQALAMMQAMPQYNPQLFLPFNPMLPQIAPGFPWNAAGAGLGSNIPHARPEDPPSSPIHAPDVSDVSEWCQQHKLDASVEAGLEQLGFVPGDNLELITEQQAKEAGFKPLAWNRVLKVYRRERRKQ